MFENKTIPNTNIYMEISEFHQNPYINETNINLTFNLDTCKMIWMQNPMFVMKK